MAWRAATVLILLPGFFSACGDPGTEPPVPTTLTISPDSLTFDALAATAHLAATVHDQHGKAMTEVVVSWRSSGPAVATVDQTGLVTAVDNGTATIHATLEGLADSVSAQVRQVPAEVAISPEDDPLVFGTLGDSVRLSAQVLDANGHPVAGVPVTWSISDTSVATIDGDGLVTARGNGNATVSATARAVTGSRRVEVDQVPVTIEVLAPMDTIAVGDSLRLAARAFDAGGSLIEDADFAWTSSDTAVATVNPAGWVHALAEGSVEITATLKGLSASVRLNALPPDEIALLALFRSAGGNSWSQSTNWGTDAPLDEWFGIELDDRGRVESVNLPVNNLAGTLPPEIGRLTALRELHLEANRLEGTLPPEIGNLESLQWLGLYGNELNGPLPPEVGELSDVQILDLAFNSFTGSIPVEITRLPRLWYLGLFSNELTGEIPQEIGDLPGLRFLDLAYNRLTGPIPPEIGNLESLESLMLYGIDTNPEKGNRLTGRIPPEIGNLANLRALNLGANRLEGPIPPEVANLAKLDSLALYSNLLTAIPPELGNLTDLQYLSLYGNRLTGAIPLELGNLTELHTLLLGRGHTSGDNTLTGTIPTELGSLTKLERLDLGGNELTGGIPSELGRLTRLEFLELGSNGLSGKIPPELGKLTRLTRLATCPNDLSGPIPGEVGRLRALYYLFLCSNNLSGPLPPEIGNLANLRFLHLGANRLTGQLPETMLALKRLLEFRWPRNDGLCAPKTEEFEEWLDGIPSSSDIYCESASMGPGQAGVGAAGPGVRGSGPHGIRPALHPGGFVHGLPGGCLVTVAAAQPAMGPGGREADPGVVRGRPAGRAEAGAGVGEGGTWVVGCGRR